MPDAAYEDASRETGHGLPAQIAADRPWDVGFATFAEPCHRTKLLMLPQGRIVAGPSSCVVARVSQPLERIACVAIPSKIALMLSASNTRP
jgi:hypothetical protein